VGKGTKIDDQVHIGHDVKIGVHCIIAGQVGIAGNTKVGNWVVLYGKVAVNKNIEIGDRAVVMATTRCAQIISREAKRTLAVRQRRQAYFCKTICYHQKIARPMGKIEKAITNANGSATSSQSFDELSILFFPIRCITKYNQTFARATHSCINQKQGLAIFLILCR
jgi:hypothetical protein